MIMLPISQCKIKIFVFFFSVIQCYNCCCTHNATKKNELIFQLDLNATLRDLLFYFFSLGHDTSETGLFVCLFFSSFQMSLMLKIYWVDIWFIERYWPQTKLVIVSSYRSKWHLELMKISYLFLSSCLDWLNTQSNWPTSTFSWVNTSEYKMYKKQSIKNSFVRSYQTTANIVLHSLS